MERWQWCRSEATLSSSKIGLLLRRSPDLTQSSIVHYASPLSLFKPAACWNNEVHDRDRLLSCRHCAFSHDHDRRLCASTTIRPNITQGHNIYDACLWFHAWTWAWEDYTWFGTRRILCNVSAHHSSSSILKQGHKLYTDIANPTCLLSKSDLRREYYDDMHLSKALGYYSYAADLCLAFIISLPTKRC